MNSQASQHLLELLIDHLKPILTDFEYQPSQTAISSGGSFSNGFLVNDKIKIGLIFRGENLGCVTYEVPGGNISHDTLFKLLGKETSKNLFYNSDNFKSYTSLSSGINEALFLDLQKVVIPFINESSSDKIKDIIQEAYNERWK